MDTDPRHDHHEDPAERSTRLLAHLDGVLDASMLDAMQGAWSMLEHAATDGPAHARAVRARMFWESMDPGAAALAAPASLVGDLVPMWDDDEAESLDALESADEPADGELDGEVAEAA